jgi:ABC-type nickel/cobalt efflux system permease component RcnA
LELAVGVLIVALAVRLLVRWRRGYLHEHVHAHDGIPHTHPHMHDERSHGTRPHAHGHTHDQRLRSTGTAFAVGLVHGAGGSAGVGILLVAAIPGRSAGVAALVVLAVGTAISMALISAALGQGLGSRRLQLRRLTPIFGVAGTLFGAWYALAAVGALPYFAS